MLAASQLSVHAQGRERPNLSQEKAPQPTLVQAAKIETSGGQKTETRATKKMKWRTAGTTASSDSRANTPGNLGTPENNDAGGMKTAGPSGAKTAATYNVGVVAGANGCPPGSDLISIRLDNEDDHNANTSGGWIGATVRDNNTVLKVCRVNGTLFKSSADFYAVLQLGTSCPSGSQAFYRDFDDEDDQNNNSVSYSPVSSGSSIDPSNSSINSSSTHLAFCLFLPSMTPSPFPVLGVEYGVFAASDFPGALATGFTYLDDEDKKNENGYGGVYFSYSQAGKIIGGDANTTINFVKVGGSGGPSYDMSTHTAWHSGELQKQQGKKKIIMSVWCDYGHDGPSTYWWQVKYNLRAEDKNGAGSGWHEVVDLYALTYNFTYKIGSGSPTTKNGNIDLSGRSRVNWEVIDYGDHASAVPTFITNTFTGKRGGGSSGIDLDWP
jgi:hypothetical protein